MASSFEKASQAPSTLPPPFAGRAVAVEVDFGLSSPIVVYSFTVATGGRLCESNLAALATVGADARSRSLPFIIAGDLQVDPRTLADSTFAQCQGARIIAPTCPLGARVCTRTSAASVIDYFIVSTGLATAAAPAAPVPGWPGNPRRPIPLQLAADYNELYVLRFGTHVALPADPTLRPRTSPPLLGSRA